MAATLIFKSGTATGAARFMAILDALLTNAFSSVEPRGLGFTRAYTYATNDYLYTSLGYSRSERIYLRFAASLSDAYIDRSMCQYARLSDGVMVNAMGSTVQTRIQLGLAQFEYWIVANQDFMHIVIFSGSTYSHYYSGIINRFAPNQNSSIYGQVAPSPPSTNTPLAIPFTIGTNTTLFLRVGFDIFGGYDATNVSFFPGQKLGIIDQSIATTTTGNQGIVILNSVNIAQNSINVTYLSGSNKFSSFSLIGVDPQPTTLNTNGTIRDNPFLMLDDYSGDSMPQFIAVDEFSPGIGLPPESIQNPDVRNVYITYPIRLYNTQEIRGTLFAIIDTPMGSPAAQDMLQTFDMLYKFIIFPDSNTHMIAIGSII